VDLVIPEMPAWEILAQAVPVILAQVDLVIPEMPAQETPAQVVPGVQAWARIFRRTTRWRSS
jgi:hypothetical protein